MEAVARNLGNRGNLDQNVGVVKPTDLYCGGNGERLSKKFFADVTSAHELLDVR